jgi:hypothetical protein
MNKDEIFSTSFQSGNRTYFLDVKKTKEGDNYLKISESKRINETDFERHQIMIFEESIGKFADALNQTVAEMQKPKKAYSVENIREKNPKAYMPWTEEDDKRLELLYCEGKSITELSTIFGRNSGAIRSRIKKLELTEKYGTRT